MNNALNEQFASEEAVPSGHSMEGQPRVPKVRKLPPHLMSTVEFVEFLKGGKPSTLIDDVRSRMEEEFNRPIVQSDVIGPAWPDSPIAEDGQTSGMILSH